MARQFNGTTQRMITASNLDLSAVNVVSVSFWMYWDSFANDDDFALEFTPDANSPETGGFYVDPNSAQGGGTFELVLYGNVGGNGATFTRPTAAAWHHYVAIFDKSQSGNGGEVDLYIDGSAAANKVGTAANDNTNNFANSTLSLMARSSGPAVFGAGRMADLALWKSRLSGANVTNLNNGTLPNAISPAADFYWKICGTTSPEPATLGGIDLTLINAPTQIGHPSAVSASCVAAFMGAISSLRPLTGLK